MQQPFLLARDVQAYFTTIKNQNKSTHSITTRHLKMHRIILKENLYPHIHYYIKKKCIPQQLQLLVELIKVFRSRQDGFLHSNPFAIQGRFVYNTLSPYSRDKLSTQSHNDCISFPSQIGSAIVTIQ